MLPSQPSWVIRTIQACRAASRPGCCCGTARCRCCPSCGPDRSQADALASLVDTERSFAAAADEHGMKVAFLRFLHDESILFRPHPVNGKRYTAAQQESGVRLEWEPIAGRSLARRGISAGPPVPIV